MDDLGKKLETHGLVIYNILKIAVSRHLEQYGTLRALGAEKVQLYAIVAADILCLCMAGIPGALSAKGILSAALNQLSPEMFLAGDMGQLQALIDANSTGSRGVGETQKTECRKDSQL